MESKSGIFSAKFAQTRENRDLRRFGIFSRAVKRYPQEMKKLQNTATVCKKVRFIEHI